MTRSRGGAPDTTADNLSAVNGSGITESPTLSLAESTHELVEYRQTALSEFPPSEEWFENNITDMDQAEKFGRVLIEIGERTQLTLGLLFLHVEKHKGGRGLKGGKSELASRLKISRQNAYECISYAEGERKVSEFLTPLGELPLTHYELISKSSNPDKTMEFIAESIEENGKPPKIREVAAENRKIEREAKIEKLADIPSREDIVLDSITNIEKYLRPNSVDLILTDPPYPHEYLPLWEILGEKAARVLRPGGFLIAYSGHYYLPDVFSMLMSSPMEYVWTLALIHDGAHQAIHPRRIHAAWKPILIFCKPPYEPQLEWMSDVIKGTGREKEDHEWQQSLGEAEELITRFTLPNQLVVDPFLGSGTTVLAAKNTGRNFFGMDNDELAVKTTLRRLAGEE